jgi:hypothetical protein
MKPEEYGLLIPQYLAGQLTEEDHRLFEEQLAVNAELRVETEDLRALWENLALIPEEEPSLAMRARFYQKLNALTRPQNAASTKKAFSWHLAPLLQVALGLFIFALGIYVGHVKNENTAPAEQIAQMNAQVQSLREVVALSLLDRKSATSRLEGVSWSSQVDQPNDKLLAALLSALNDDSNVNVRLSSLNALERFTKNAEVRQALTDSIQRQDSPLVQIALIDLLVQIRNRSAESALKKLSTNTDVNPAVRQRAQWGIQKLTYE